MIGGCMLIRPNGLTRPKEVDIGELTNVKNYGRMIVINLIENGKYKKTPTHSITIYNHSFRAGKGRVLGSSDIAHSTNVYYGTVMGLLNNENKINPDAIVTIKSFRYGLWADDMHVDDTVRIIHSSSYDINMGADGGRYMSKAPYFIPKPIYYNDEHSIVSGEAPEEFELTVSENLISELTSGPHDRDFHFLLRDLVDDKTKVLTASYGKAFVTPASNLEYAVNLIGSTINYQASYMMLNRIDLVMESGNGFNITRIGTAHAIDLRGEDFKSLYEEFLYNMSGTYSEFCELVADDGYRVELFYREGVTKGHIFHNKWSEVDEKDQYIPFTIHLQTINSL